MELQPDSAHTDRQQEQVEILREHLNAARSDADSSKHMPPQRPSMSSRHSWQPKVRFGQQLFEAPAQNYGSGVPQGSYNYGRRRSATYAGDPLKRPPEPVMQQRKPSSAFGPTATDGAFSAHAPRYNYNQEQQQQQRPRSSTCYDQQQYPRYRRTSIGSQYRPQHRQDYFSFAKPEPDSLPSSRTPSMTSQSDFSSDSNSDAEEPSGAYYGRNRHWRMF